MTYADSPKTIRFAWVPFLIWAACSDSKPLPVRSDGGRDTGASDAASERVGATGGSTGSGGVGATGGSTGSGGAGATGGSTGSGGAVRLDGAAATGGVVGMDGPAGTAGMEAGGPADSAPISTGGNAGADVSIGGADGGGSVADAALDSAAEETPVTDASSRCNILQPLEGLLTERRTRKVLFTHDGSAVVLLTVNEVGGDDVLVMSLPGGEQIPLATGVADMEWLGSDGRASRQIADGVCAHATSPDGLVVYALRDCDGPLAAVDVIDTGPGDRPWLPARALRDFLSCIAVQVRNIRGP